MTAALDFTVNADQAIAQLGDLAAGAGQAAVIVRAREVLGRAQDRAWITGGLRAVYAMALLETALADPDRDSLAVLAVEAATENLLLVIARECGQDEARYVTEGDE